jgi:sugar lactone lactonase YvrE
MQMKLTLAELAPDAKDNLYGEHLWYEGERTNRWGHRVWRRSPDGKIIDVIPPTEGFLQNYSFVRDGAGAMYWMDRAHNAVMKRRGDSIAVHARGIFRDPRWMHATRDGTLWLIDATDLVRVAPNGVISRVARGLSSGRLMGIWSDPAGNICVADFAHGEVKRVTANGKVTTIFSCSSIRSRTPRASAA